MMPPSSPRFGGTTSRLCVPTLPFMIAFTSAVPPGVRFTSTFLTGVFSGAVGPLYLNPTVPAGAQPLAPST